MLSVTAVGAAKHVLEDPCSLYVQSNANPRRLQGDGWGIGHYVDGTSNLIRSERPVYEEHEKFVSAVGKARSKVVLAHIRRASNPRGLPREKIISILNSQPFKYENYLFAHNGTINIPDEAAEGLGEWKRKIAGLNDSEVYFWYIMKAMADGSGFREALIEFERDLEDLWSENRVKHLAKSRPYVGLNALFSDGEKLYAYCRYHEEDESIRSLCLGDQPVFQMSRLNSPTSLVVSSEKTNREDDWKPLKSGQLLVGQIKGGEICLDFEDIR